jgi:hypothetical protein
LLVHIGHLSLPPNIKSPRFQTVKFNLRMV